MAKVCSKTGFALVPAPDRALRVSSTTYGPLNPPERTSAAGVAKWSRFDTFGRTIYMAENKVTAYMELLAPYRIEIDGERSSLQPLADAMKMDLEAYWELIVEEWDLDPSKGEFWLPSNFRRNRAVYELKFPDGWWIDLTAAESISALHKLFGNKWQTSGGDITRPLTRSDLESDDRTLTTSIAQGIRSRVILEDGSRPLGVKFDSKHGSPAGESGACWAYWMRELDLGRKEPAKLISETPIEADDPDLLRAQQLSGLRMH